MRVDGSNVAPYAGALRVEDSGGTRADYYTTREAKVMSSRPRTVIFEEFSNQG